MLKTDPIGGGLRTFVKKNWHILTLFLIAALSFGLNFYAISKLGYGNAYYAAAVKSMTQNVRNFFFVAFDPAGAVSVDKPPLGMWIQAVFVLIFGYHGWAMLLPQALAGTGSCIMMYLLTAKYFGRPAGLVSSLVFALTPAVVVASRNNTIDTQLVFVLLVAAWFLFKAIEKTKWRYLFLCALFVGLGFNIKMLQAYMILPAVVIVYLIFAKEKFIRRIAAGAISLLIMAAVSFAWVAAVDLTPAADRPYVDSSTNNTVSELIVGHNGLERLYGQSMGGGMGGRTKGGTQGTGGMPGNMGYGQSFGGQGPGGLADGRNDNGNPPAKPDSNGNQAGANQNGAQTSAQGASGQNGGQAGQGALNNGQGGPGGKGGGNQGGITGNDIGTAGVLRLWNSGLYGQASWLIVFTLFCIAAKFRRFHKKDLTLDQGVFVFWVVWLITMYAFFSFAGFWHRYYLCMFAPAIAGLSGPGLVGMIRAFREKRGWKRILLPASLIATSVVEIRYVWGYSGIRAWLEPLMIGAAVLSLLLMAFHYIRPKRFILPAAAGCMLVSLLAAPFYWALTAVMYVPQNITMPYAGPELASTAAVPGMTANQETLTVADSGTLALEKYLVAHYKKGSYLVVSQRANDVAQFIVDTGLPAVAYGGFLGSDNSLTLDKLKELVKEGKVTYFLVSGQNGNTDSELISYVEKNATLVNSSEYGTADSKQSADGASGQSNGVSGYSLYLFK